MINIVSVKKYFHEKYSEINFENEWRNFLIFLCKENKFELSNDNLSTEELEKYINPPVTEKKISPYHEGWEYGYYNDDPENPYPEDSFEWEEWMRGYKDGLYRYEL